jgi:aspartate/methionine/tyrosine aminotransferase
MNAPIQHAFPTMLWEAGSIRDQLLAVVRQNLRELDAQLTAQSLVSRLQVEGGWYAVLRVPATRSDEQVAIELVEQQGVLVHPGHFYDFHGEGFLVVSLITPVASFTAGIARLVQFFR